MVSEYYQAHVDKVRCWYFAAILRSYEHVCFDRTLDAQSSLFEFYVPVDTEPYFLRIMARFEKEGLVSGLVKMENRLSKPGTRL